MPVSVLVVNASPLILLSKIDQLDLLRAVGSRWLVPEAVLREINAKGPEDAVARAVAEKSWLEPATVGSIPNEVGAWDLDDGEASVIACALATPNSLPVLDDRAGRSCARAVGISVMGTAGLLLAAKLAGHVPAVKPLLDQLTSAGLYLSAVARLEILKRASETP